MSATDAWTQLTTRIGELETLAGVCAVLEWDQQTYMPTKGAAYRGQHMALMSALYHEKLTDPAVGDWLASLATDSDAVRKAAVRNIGRKYAKATKLPTKLVQAFARAQSDGFVAWNQAREAKDWMVFQPKLENLIALLKEQVAHLGEADHDYDLLLDDYDPGSTTAELRPLFDRLGTELSDFVRSIADKPSPAALDTTCDAAGQARLSGEIIRAMGFDMDAGRLDVSVHPFTCGTGPQDVRLTTHYHERDLINTLGSTIHECGHGLYEQGLPEDWAGTSLRNAAGMGLHESQSRFWENHIGRSRAFCRWVLPRVRKQWPDFPLDAEALYGAMNRVEPSLIRVAADEVTYNLHIIVRFQLELALITGDLAVADLPGAWNDAYERVVTVRPGNDLEGVLQDVHWSSGLFGYFPSYTVGNLYAASFKHQMELDLPDMWNQVERGEFAPILGWLRDKVHLRGHELDAPEIFRQAVGDRDPVADHMAHIQARHGALYGT
jgi:carboxypeptidase Taq